MSLNQVPRSLPPDPPQHPADPEGLPPRWALIVSLSIAVGLAIGGTTGAAAGVFAGIVTLGVLHRVLRR